MITITNFSNKQVTLVNGKIIMPGNKLLIEAKGELLAQIKFLANKGILVIS